MGRLTVARVRALTRPGRYGAGGTLFLNIAPGGSKSWVQRVVINGKRRDIGLGGWPVVSLAKARERAFANRVAIADGRDPLAEKRKAGVPTFREAAAKTYEANCPRWRSEKTAANWMQQMERHAFPILGDMPVDQIGREDVLRVLSPIWGRKLDIARKLRGRIRAVLAWAQAHGAVEVNVAGEAIDGALPTMPTIGDHYKALPYQEVAMALETVEASRASLPAKACFRFTVLTACRSGEARGATWDEVDTEAREWRIPGGRMKSGAEHRIPLSDAALEVLESVRPLQRDLSDLVFPSPSKPGKPLSVVELQEVTFSGQRSTGLIDDMRVAVIPARDHGADAGGCAPAG